ncbi:MAG: hypothetical protein MZV70_32665 [Desulfobacterales bacterium]|nr:hypothetical protein [Desulfobacterales bacterium]
MVTLEDIFRDRLPFLGIRHIVEPQGLKKPFSGLPIKCSRSIRRAHHQEGAIIILSCGAKEKLLALPDPLSQEFFCQSYLLQDGVADFCSKHDMAGFPEKTTQTSSPAGGDFLPS